MQIRSLLAILVTCSAAFGCQTPPAQSVGEQARSEPPVRTGTRLPGHGAGMTGTIGADDYRNDRARQGSTADIVR